MVNQSDIFQPLTQSSFAELCTALYERELVSLSRTGPDNTRFMKRRLASLPFYIKRAAFALPVIDTPLQLDVQNASWQAQQAAKPPGHKHQADRCGEWFRQHAALGLVVAVQLSHYEQYQVMLDSIDQIDHDGQRVHVNQFGWFSIAEADAGAVLEADTSGVERVLLKPTKAVMTAACCGHQWGPRGRVAPRTLSLREILLAATLTWPRFTSVRSLPN